MPYTRKRTIFRKKLEGMFGGQVARLLGNGDVEDNLEQPTKVSDFQESPARSRWLKVDVMDTVLKTVADALKISITVLNTHPESSFAEVRIFISYYFVVHPYSCLFEVWNGLRHGRQNRQPNQPPF